MITVYSLVVYKNRPALVKEIQGDKIHIELPDGQIVKAREKDFEMIHPGPAKDLRFAENEAGLSGAGQTDAVRDTWELLESEGGTVSLRELADLAFGAYTPASAWAAFQLLADGLYFTGTPETIAPRKRETVEADEQKRQEKQKEAEDRERFLEDMRRRIKTSQTSSPGGNTISAGDILPEDTLPAELAAGSRFIQDVESLALGKSSKSKTMKDLGLSENPQDAHNLLLSAGFWTVRNNPHPARFGLSLTCPQITFEPPPPEQRRDLTHLAAFAIDNSWSRDPDDAVSLTEANGRRVLYAHIADPASSITAEDLSEREARDRGATLYLPEATVWMLGEQSISRFALGLEETSPALTFEITLDENGEIADTGIYPSIVKVSRLSYPEADNLLNGEHGQTNTAPGSAAGILRGLWELAEQNTRRRVNSGAVNIDLPETHISLAADRLTIEPVLPYKSADMIRECMLLAGEGAARWAIERRLGADSSGGLAFPFVSQEAGDIPGNVLPGFAGSYQLRRCMRPRTLSLKPAPHWGLGLNMYTQVTSPLRRYTDLLAHLQIRAFLRGETPLTAEEVSARLGAGEAAASASVQAERASRAHWTAVYLSNKKDSIWNAAALEKKGNRWALVIPALALETQVPLRGNIAPNDEVKLVLKSVNIPRSEAVFVEE